MSFGLNTDPSLIHGGELGTLNKFGGCNKRYPGSGKLMERGNWKRNVYLCLFTFERIKVRINCKIGELRLQDDQKDDFFCWIRLEATLIEVKRDKMGWKVKRKKKELWKYEGRTVISTSNIFIVRGDSFRLVEENKVWWENQWKLCPRVIK